MISYQSKTLSLIPGSRHGILTLTGVRGLPDQYLRIEFESDQLLEIEDVLLLQSWRDGGADLVRYWTQPGDLRLLRVGLLRDFSSNPYNGLELTYEIGVEKVSLPPLQLSDPETPGISQTWLPMIADRGYHKWVWRAATTAEGRREGSPPRFAGKWWDIARTFPEPPDAGHQIIYDFDHHGVQVYRIDWWCSVRPEDQVSLKLEGKTAGGEDK